MFQGKIARTFLDSNARMFQNKYARTFQGKVARMYLSNNARMYQDRSARRSVKTFGGVRFAAKEVLRL